MKQPKLVPLYHQIYLTLRNQLLSGRYAPTDGEPSPLPSEMEMTELFGASRITVRHALKKLEEEGLVERRHGVGTFGRPPPERVFVTTAVDRIYHGMSALIDEYEPEILTLAQVPTPAFVLAQIPTFGAQCLQKSLLSRRDGKPVHLNNQYIPERLMAKIDMERAGQVPLLLLLQTQGVSSVATDVVLSATAADIYAATKLEVAAGAPLITTKRISVDAEGAAIEYFESQTRPDQYGYKFRFSGT